jgi:putative transposase
LALIDKSRELSVIRQCGLLEINRSTLYYKPAAPDPLMLLIKQVIDHIYTDLPFYGYRRMTKELSEVYGLLINRKTTQRYMREMGIEAVYPKPNTSKPDPENKVYPYLLKGLKIAYPNQVWSTDITYIPMLCGFMYLTAIIDWFSRYVLSWALSDTLEMDFVLEAVRDALNHGRPDIMNSDQGSHYTSPKYTQILLKAGVSISMDHRGRCFDNIFVERLWRSVKYECVYINEFNSPRELRNKLTEYFELYNYKRYHQSLGYLTPAQVHFAL